MGTTIDWRDPRIEPAAGDVVDVDLGDGDTERREVISIEKHSLWKRVVRCHIDGDKAHVRNIRIRDWRELADEMTAIKRGL